MAMFGGSFLGQDPFGQKRNDYSVPIVEQATPALPPPQPGFNDVGGTADKLRRLAGHLMQIGGIDKSGENLIDEVDERQKQQSDLQRTGLMQNAEYQKWIAQQQYKAAHPDPLTPTELDRNLIAGGVTQDSPQWAALHRQAAQNAVDPIHAYPTTDANGNEGLIFKRPSEMGGTPGTPAVQIKSAADYDALAPGSPYIDPNGKHRVKGGAAPSGTGGFPLYPAGYQRN